MAKTTQYQIQLKEEVTAALRNIEAKVATTNQKMGELQAAGSKAFDVAKVTAFGAAALVALEKVIDFGAQAVKAYGDFEEKSLRLTAQLKVSGNQIGLTASQILDLASALEGVTGIDDSDILDAVSTMQTFQNVTGSAFKEAITQATNMSVVFGDVDTAAKQLGAALDDPVNNLDKLKKASIFFTDAEKEQIKALQDSGDLLGAQAIVLDKVKSKFDGLAASVNGGVNGSMRNFSNAWDDAMKAMGSSFAQFAKPAIDALTDALNLMNGNKITLAGVLGGGTKLEGQSSEKLTDLMAQIQAFKAKASGDGPTVRRVLALEKLVQSMLATAAKESGTGGTVGGAGTPAFITSANTTDTGGPVGAFSSLPLEAQRGIQAFAVMGEARKRDAEYAKALADEASANAAEQDAERQKRAQEDAAWAHQMTEDALADSKAREDAELERIAKEKAAQQDLFNTLAMGWGEVSKIVGLLADQQERIDQDRIDRLKGDLDAYTTAQDLKIEVAKRNGEDVGQLEMDKVNEVFAQKKRIDEEERKNKRKAWEANKQASLTNIVMAGAEAQIKAWQLAPPFNYIQAALAGASAVAQLAIVSGQSAPAFARGGVVPGDSSSGDNIWGRLNSGEMVLNQGQQARLLGLANGGGSGGRMVYIERVYGSVDKEFLDELDRSLELRAYRGLN